MKSQAWLDSLRRSASLAQEVLERASRRAVDWNDPGLTPTSSTPDSADNKRTRTERDVSVSSTAQVVGQREKHLSSSSDEDEDADVDVHVRVSPGTYAVTASIADSQQQTLLVSLKAGESFKLKFNF